MIISAKINVSKIDKTKLFKGKEGTYLDITLISNKGGRNQYDNDGMVVQDLGKEARKAGKKGEILGNYRIMINDSGSGQASPAPEPAPDTDDIPF